MDQPEQSFDNHAKTVPLYHFGLTILVMSVLVYSLIQVFQDFSVDTLMMAVMAMALLGTTIFARIFPMGVQDRVIRLEERLRMKEVLPEDLQDRIEDFTTEQLIALRFATDRELPDLARRVLDESMADRKAIKQAVAVWRPDHQRI